MERSQSKPVEQRKTSFWKDKFVLIAVAVAFTAPLIWLESNGTNTGEVFSKIVGFVIIASLLIGVGSLFITVFSRLFDFLVGKK